MLMPSKSMPLDIRRFTGLMLLTCLFRLRSSSCGPSIIKYIVKIICAHNFTTATLTISTIANNSPIACCFKVFSGALLRIENPQSAIENDNNKKTTREKIKKPGHPYDSQVWLLFARDWSRTSTRLLSLAPQASASANSATRA